MLQSGHEMALRLQVEEVEDNGTTSHQAGIFCKDSNGEDRQEQSVSATAENQKLIFPVGRYIHTPLSPAPWISMWRMTTNRSL
jgi:hypothetical protein